MEGSIKWLLLASVCTVFAVVIMLIGLYRNNKILNRQTDIPEEQEGNKLLAKKVFIKHTAVAAALIVIAIVLKLIFGRNG